MDEHDDAAATMLTGIHQQRLILRGWFASHADTGRPGPHVHLVAGGSTMQGAVLRTDQVPDLVEALAMVAERIDRQWERDGEKFLRTFPTDEPDPNDPAVITRRRIERLELDLLVAEHITEVVGLVLGAADIHEATDSVAALLGVDPIAVEGHLRGFSLLGLSRDSRAAKAEALRGLRGED